MKISLWLNSAPLDRAEEKGKSGRPSERSVDRKKRILAPQKRVQLVKRQ
jgi:hypothetical protein